MIFYIIFHVFVHVYSPGQGQTTPWGSEFLCKHIPHVTLVICCKFLPLNDFLTDFPHNKAYGTKFDLAVKYVVNLGSSFEQTMMGLSPQCYIPSHKVTGPLVLEKIFEGFLPYMGVVAILVM